MARGRVRSTGGLGDVALVLPVRVHCVQVVGHTRARDKAVETVIRSVVEYFPPIRIFVHAG